ncbi:DEHA2F16082p [Debaryomyces hansenii CBS767]|uniref:DEHA2F16082p n=1 Tax=Debaryomyces hansenii (strain ATCC 36239 / CBS 767 / BCRC 21394 / JCM 1990 / NBRC 0083 / IGC 2968) TaxID=284592 RepID=Q6BL63_DEBHA|nr:DEHA2F16082p [Debaryomyces hansenii CBS767]CAG89434.2 DEHA2F16082p [Debaryomyces hansenii CBS767]|eukprot:XP_461058.2 DEHA2F16082p [Debaryomyces hansenii CBS767]
MTSTPSNEVIEQLNQARNLAFSSKETFPQVLRQILQFASNPDIQIQRWCSKFFKESFLADETVLSRADKVDLAIDSIDSLIILLEIRDAEIFKDCIDTAIVVFRLVFRYVAENDGCGDVWQKLNELKNTLTNKFQSTFPLAPSDDEEHDMVRSIDSKLEILKFVILVIDYQSKSPSNITSFSLSQVPPNHSLIKQSIEAEAYGLVDVVLKVITNDILIPPLVTAVFNHFSVLARRKPQFVSKMLNVIENFDTNTKLQSNYQTIDEYKLSKKYVDRILRIFLNHLLRNQLVPSNYTSSLNKKLSLLVNRGDDIRKKNILSPSPEDSNIKKRKFDGFVNPSKRCKTNDYKNLYCLTDSTNELNNFDIATLPQNMLISMTLASLNKVSTNKLNKALDIIGERYKYAVANFSPTEIKKEQEGEYDDEDNDGDDFSPETNYTLPPPKDLSYQDKKEHINLIIKNFFKLADKNVSDVEEKQELGGKDTVTKELTKIAIKAWKKDSWFVLLTRLATRGMRTVDSTKTVIGSEKVENESTDVAQNEELSDLIRQSIFDHFLDNVHSRIDLIIEWLNEEWYSEKVFNEDVVYKQLTEKYIEEYESNPVENDSVEERVNREIDNIEIPTPTYNKWTGKVLDSLIPFLEPNDKKIFIRLLSDLPYLNEDLVSRIKSLCFDPVRSKIGFLSLQFLIMYRPPVKSACIHILEDLSNSDQEDLKEEATKLLKKYEQ